MASVGYTGDGGPAINAQFSSPGGIAMDAHGNLYIADQNNNVIREVNLAGIISTVAGTGASGFGGDGGPATAALLSLTTGIAVDGAGNMYISDDGNQRIRKVSASGIITTIAGNGAAGFSGDGGMATLAQINDPYTILIDLTGNILFADNSNDRIRKIDPAGVITTVAGNGGYGLFSGGGGPATSATVSYPEGIAFDAAYNLYTGASGVGYICKVALSSYISASRFSIYLNRICNGDQFWVTANSSSALNLKTSFGDGTSNVSPLTFSAPGLQGVNIAHAYPAAGTYTVKMVLLNGATCYRLRNLSLCIPITATRLA